MEKKIFMFRFRNIQEKTLVFEVISNEGDNWYWARINGTEVSLEEAVDMLNQQELELKG